MYGISKSLLPRFYIPENNALRFYTPENNALSVCLKSTPVITIIKLLIHTLIVASYSME